MPRLPLLALATGVLLAVPGAAAADPLPTGGTLLVGAAAPGVFTPLPTPVGLSYAGPHAISQDGRFVVFGSDSDGLVDGDDDRATGVYRKDRVTGDVILISRTTTGAPNTGTCGAPTISSDGSRVAFTCESALDPADVNGQEDVYVRDVAAGTTTLISRTPAALGNGPSNAAQISGNGQWVAFTSSATNFVSPAPPAGTHVYRRAVAGGALDLIDRPNGTGLPNNTAYEPTISDDGDRVAFTSWATNLSPGTDANGTGDVYLRKVAGGITQPISTVDGNPGVMANAGASAPSISGNGFYVAYQTTSNNDVASDPDATWDVRRRSLDASNAVVLVSRASGVAGAKGDQASSGPQLDASGQWVAFASSASTLVPSAPDASEIYVRHLGASPTTELASQGASGPAAAGATWPAISGDAQTITFAAQHLTADSDPGLDGIFARDLQAKATMLVSRPAGTGPFANLGADAVLAGPGALSADGRYAVFTSDARGLPGAVEGVTQIWRRDTLTGDVALVSRADGPAGAPGDDDSRSATISADGTRVAFISTAANLTADGAADGEDVYVRDLTAGTTTLTSRRDGPAGAPLTHVDDAFLAAGGTRVAFVTDDPALGATGFHVVVRDLAAGQSVVIDPATKADARRPRLDASGGRVAWSDASGSITAFRPAGRPRLTIVGGGQGFWADVADGAPHAITGDTGEAYDVTLSDDGRRAAFVTGDPLLPGDAAGKADVYVRDLSTGELTLASAGPGGAPADDHASQAAISGDGRAVAFVSEATNLVGDDGNGHAADVFVRDLAAGTTTLVSRSDGSAEAASEGQSEAPAISRDGGCVLFRSTATTFAPSLSPFVARAWLRAVRGTCPGPPPPGGGPPGGDGPGGGTPPPGKPAGRPVITRLRAHPARFARRGRKAGTRFTLKVDRAAKIRITLDRLTRGHRAGGRCRPGRGKRRCDMAHRLVTLRATAKRAGTVSVRFTARVHGRRIAAGRYRATATATTAAGTSKPLRVMLRAR